MPGRSLHVPQLGALSAPRIAARSGWRVAWRDAAVAFTASRLLAWGGALAGAGLWGTRAASAAGLPDWLATVAVRWDALHLADVARHGYPAGDGQAWAFFPVVPALARALGGTGAGVHVAGTMLALACSLGALAVLHRLASLELGDGAAARRTVWLLALCPGSFFLGAFYTEVPFLLRAVAAVYAARRERWALAGLAGAGAALTRNTGVLVLVPLLLLAWRARPPRRSPAWLGLVPLALGGWLAVALARAGDALAPWHAQATWGRTLHGPGSALLYGAERAWEALPHLGSAAAPRAFEPPWMVVLLFVLALAAAAGTVGVWRRFGTPLGLYTALALAVPLSVPWPAHPLMSLPRFAGVVFPLFLLAGRWRRAFWPLAVLFGAGLVVFAGRFGVWAWAA